MEWNQKRGEINGVKTGAFFSSSSSPLILQDGSKRLWAYVIGAYWLTIVTMHRLWKTYKHVVQLRSVDQSNPQKVKVEQYAVLVRDIPAPLPGTGTIHDRVENYFKPLYWETYGGCVIVTKTSNVYY
mgnify:CR=1 FL=1